MRCGLIPVWLPRTIYVDGALPILEYLPQKEGVMLMELDMLYPLVHASQISATEGKQ